MKMFYNMGIFRIGLKKFLWLKKLKTLCRGHILLMILTEKKLLKRFTKKISQKEFRVEKIKRRKGDKLYVKCKGYDSSLVS